MDKIGFDTHILEKQHYNNGQWFFRIKFGKLRYREIGKLKYKFVVSKQQ
jgi:hypothetical protein